MWFEERTTSDSFAQRNIMKKIGRIEFISMSIALMAGANYWALAFPEKGKKKKVNR
jgi:hypothetical protein